MNKKQRRALVIALGIALGIAGCGTPPPPPEPGVPGVPARVAEEEKSMILGELLAIFPGIFVHGIGQFYANKNERGKELLAEEGIGVVAMGLGAGLTYLAFVDNGHAEHSKGVEKVYGRISEVSEYLGGGAAGIFGVIFFFDSWIRDMIETPAAVDAYNRTVKTRLEGSVHHYVPPDEAVTGSQSTTQPRPQSESGLGGKPSTIPKDNK